MERVAADVAIGLGPGAGRHLPAPLARAVVQLPAQGAHQAGRGAAGVGRGEDAQGVGAAEGAHHGRGVFDVAPGDEVLEQREPGIVEWQVRGGLGASARRCERAKDERGENHPG